LEHVFELEFDWMIILDAMRYDVFKLLNPFKGDLKPIISPAHATEPFLVKAPKTDALVVSGHPFLMKHKKKFRKMIDAGWSHELGTTPPEWITNYIWSVKGKEPIILWYLQPHPPFIAFYEELKRRGLPLSLLPHRDEPQEYAHLDALGLLWDAYVSNAKWIIQHLERYVIPNIQGRIIISSDHALGLGRPRRTGEPPVYGHYGCKPTTEILEVPLLIMEV